MELTRENVEKVAHLARLRMGDECIEAMRQNLTNILGWIDMLDEVDVKNVEPMISVNQEQMRRREDVVTDGGIAKDIVANAPGGAQYDMFVVPKVVE
jgi:aspartyl-tRNA(Asn)/glutamyl-tRNA(Gln) amidotransferase subunit C